MVTLTGILTLLSASWLCQSVFSSLTSYLSSTLSKPWVFLAFQKVYILKTINWTRTLPSNRSFSAYHHFPLYCYFPCMEIRVYHIYLKCVYVLKEPSFKLFSSSHPYLWPSTKTQMRKKRQFDSFPEEMEKFSQFSVLFKSLE